MLPHPDDSTTAEVEARAPTGARFPLPALGAPPAPATSLSLRRVLITGGLAGVLAALLLLLYAPEIREATLWLMPSFTHRSPGPSPKALRATVRSLEKETQRLRARLDARTPQGPYLIVSTTDNRFRLMNGDLLTREGICSTGSYVHLKGADNREWLFETPRGPFRILKKTENPIWTKPDWAFIEEGLPVPPPGSSERIERGVLGDYSLALGHGYLLHGTLYQRLLGLPVTHGCVRLGDDDLAAIYHALRIGSPVFIY